MVMAQLKTRMPRKRWAVGLNTLDWKIVTNDIDIKHVSLAQEFVTDFDAYPSTPDLQQ